MLRIERFRACHLRSLKVQAPQAYVSHLLTPEYGRSLEGPHAFTGVYNGRVVVCAGVEYQWAGRGIAWALLSECSPVVFVLIHRAILRFLEGCDLRRIETSVDLGYGPGHRWAQLLGFEVEGLMRGHQPDGRDSILYARVRNHS